MLMNCDAHISRSELEQSPVGDGVGDEGESTPLVARPLSLAAAMRGGGGRRLLDDDVFLGILAGPPPVWAIFFQMMVDGRLIGMVS